MIKMHIFKEHFLVKKTSINNGHSKKAFALSQAAQDLCILKSFQKVVPEL